MFDLLNINLAAFVATIFAIWLLALQRGLIHKFFGQRQLMRAILEGCLILAMAFAVHELFKLLGEAPRLVDFHRAFEVVSEIVIYVGWAGLVGRFAEGFLFHKKAAREDWQLSKLARASIYGVCLAVSLSVFSVKYDITPAEVFVWTGATAAVLAFVMQQTLGDLFSGLAISLERPFKLGDWLRLPDGTEGQVIDINWRATHLRAWDKTTFVIPNAKLAQESFTNLHGRNHAFAPWYVVKVSGEHSPEHVLELLKQATEACTYPLPTPAPVVRLMNAEKSPYEYMVWLHFEDYPTMFAGREELYRSIDAILRAEQIAIAADIQEVRLNQNMSQPVLSSQ